MTLRLPSSLEERLSARAERTGRSRQQIINDALDHYLTSKGDPRVAALLDTGRLRRRERGRRPTWLVRLPPGMTSQQLLDEQRAERL